MDRRGQVDGPDKGTPGPSFTLAFNQGTFTVSWSTVTGADKYRVRIRVGAGHWQNRPAVTGTSDFFPPPEEIVCGSSFTFTMQSHENASTEMILYAAILDWI